MKVLKKANKKSWTKKFTCRGCQAVLEVNAGDLRKVSDTRDGAYAVCECPECRTQVTWDASLIPKAVWKQLQVSSV